MRDRLAHARRDEPDAVLVDLDLLGHADAHGCLPAGSMREAAYRLLNPHCRNALSQTSPRRGEVKGCAVKRSGRSRPGASWWRRSASYRPGPPTPTGCPWWSRRRGGCRSRRCRAHGGTRGRRRAPAAGPCVSVSKDFAAVARARDHDLAVDGNALLVLDRGDEPGGVGLVRMHDDGEAERRRPRLLDLHPRLAAVVGAEDAVVVLHPQPVGSGAALHQAMRVLDVGVLACSGGMNSARMPVIAESQVAPPSVVVTTPPQDTPTCTRFASRGSTQMEWMPGRSAPPPIHFLRRGCPTACA